MRDIIFHEVGMENFGPYIDPMILNFENNKLTLITGPNGIGKTMSLEALPFTLFGETCKKARGDDVVNTRVGKNCHTWATFSINNDKYKVDRYHKYSKLGTTVTIVKNNEDQPYKKGHREVVPEIERLICSKKSFMNTLMFGQKVKDFFTDLVDSDKKEIFRKILDLDIYTKWYKEADNNLKEIKEIMLETTEQIGINKGILSDTELQIGILFKQMKQFEENKKEKSAILIMILKDLLKLWHPFMPFITENIWKEMGNKKFLMVEKWPTEKKYLEILDMPNEAEWYIFSKIQSIITAIRNARAENKIEPGKKTKAVIYAGEHYDMIKDEKVLIKKLRTGIDELKIKQKGEKIPKAIRILECGIEIYLINAIDEKKEKARAKKELENLKKYASGLEKKLKNKNFIEKAPEEIVRQEKENLKKAKVKILEIEKYLKGLN